MHKFKFKFLYLILVVIAFFIIWLFLPPSFNCVTEPGQETRTSKESNRIHFGQTILVRHYLRTTEGLIKMVLDYHYKNGLSLEEIKLQGNIDSYSINFYMNNDVTRSIFIDKQHWRDPYYVMNYLGAINIFRDYGDSTKWKVDLNITNPKFRDSPRSWYLVDETREKDNTINSVTKEWVNYYRKLEQKRQSRHDVK